LIGGHQFANRLKFALAKGFTSVGCGSFVAFEQQISEK